MTARSTIGVLLATLGAGLLLSGSGARATDGAEWADPPAEAALPQPISLCGPPSSLLIDDFEDGDEQTPDGLGSWYFREGSVELNRLVVPGGPAPSRFAAHIAGPLDPEESDWLGVFLGCARDARQLAGYRFAVRGSGDVYAKVVTLATTDIQHGGTCSNTSPDPDLTTCGDHYSTQEPIALLDDRWYECSIRFRDLAQLGWGSRVRFDPKAVVGVELNPVFGAPFDFAIDDVRFAEQLDASGCRPLERRYQPAPPGHR